MTKRKISDTPIDPTLPKSSITIKGKKYNLCFDLGALAESEAAFNAQGLDINLLAALPNLNLANVRILFAASVRKFHSYLSFDAAIGLVTFSNVYAIAQMIADAWTAAMPEKGPDSEGEDQPE